MIDTSPTSNCHAARSRRRWLATLLTLVVLAAGCGVSRDSAGDGSAGTVTFGDGEDKTITQAETFGVVDEILAAPEFKAAVYAAADDAQITASIAQVAVLSKILDRQMEDQDLEVTDADLAEGDEAARQIFAGAFGSPEAETEAFAQVPTFLETLSYFQAQQAVLTGYYAKDGPQYPCARHILVETEDESAEVIARIESGEDFAAIAAEVSLDPGSGLNGGDLGCAPTDGYVPEFADAVNTADQNEIVVAVSDFGAHVIEVTGYEGDGLAGLQQGYEAIVADVTVTLDPALGTWDPDLQNVQPVTDEE